MSYPAPSSSSSSPPITIDNIRGYLKAINDFFNDNFFNESKFRQYQSIDITDLSFKQKNSTFNILNDTVYGDFFDAIKGVKDETDNFKVTYIGVIPQLIVNGTDINEKINKIFDRSEYIFGPLDSINKCIDGIAKKPNINLDKEFSLDIAFLYSLIKTEIKHIKILFSKIKDYFDTFSDSKCVDNTDIGESYGKLKILSMNTLNDGKVISHDGFIKTMLEKCDVLTNHAQPDESSYYNTLKEIINYAKYIDDEIIRILASFVDLNDHIITAFNSKCDTITKYLTVTWTKPDNNGIKDIIYNFFTKDEQSRFDTIFNGGAGKGPSNASDLAGRAQQKGMDKSPKPSSTKTNGSFGFQKGSDEYQDMIESLYDQISTIKAKINRMNYTNNKQEYYTRLHKITDYRNFKTQTDREPQDFIAQIKLKNIGGKQNISKYKYITEDSLGKATNNNRARELANNYNQLTDKMIETEKKIGGIQKLAIHDLSKSESGYIRMRGGEQQTNDYNNLIKQYQLMAIKQNNIINEIKNIKNRNKI